MRRKFPRARDFAMEKIRTVLCLFVPSLVQSDGSIKPRVRIAALWSGIFSVHGLGFILVLK